MRDRVSRATATLDTGMRKKPKAEPRRSQADSATPDAWTPALPHVVRDVDEIESALICFLTPEASPCACRRRSQQRVEFVGRGHDGVCVVQSC